MNAVADDPKMLNGVAIRKSSPWGLSSESTILKMADVKPHQLASI